jgi:putative ABC transport system permease protein
MPKPMPLAWMQLTREKLRLVVAVAGVSFAVVLMLMQLGFRAALYKSSVRLHSYLNGELFLISPQSSYLVLMRSFSRRRLYQVLGVPGVASVSSVYLMLPPWKNPETGMMRSIFVIGYDPQERVLNIPEVNRLADVLRMPDTVIFDRAARPEFGPVAARFNRGETVTAEVNNRKITVKGLFELGTSFGIDGTLITSDLNFHRIYDTDVGLIDLGVIKLKPGTDIEQMRQRLVAILPNDVEVLTKKQYIDREIAYWATVTPIGFVFTFGAIMGFVVGTVIVYQILFADVTDHLPEYATLKAMGYRNLFVFGVVLFEAVILSIFGFIPGALISMQLYTLAEKKTHLPMHLTPALGTLVLFLTIAMCCISGMIAVRKVQSADPAEIF